MKFFIPLIALLLISSTLAIKPYHLSNAQTEKIDKLMKGNSWGSIMLNLAEMHMLAAGPLDELITAITQLIEDLGVKLQKVDEDFNTRTLQYEAEVKRLNQDIDNAKLDVANTTELLNNVLYVQKAQLEDDINNLTTSIENTEAYLIEIEGERQKEHEAFEKNVAEGQSCVAAIDECLALLFDLGAEASLAQVKKAKNSLEIVQRKLGNGVDGSLLKALVSLSTSEFADQDAVEKVMTMMKQVQENLVAKIEQFQKDEEKAQRDYDEEVKNKRREINEMKIQLENKSEDLEKTKDQIANAEAFLAQRERDLKLYEDDLANEEAKYQHDTDVYNDLVAEFNIELDACNEALSLLNSSEFAGYLSNRMSQDVVIDKAHGSDVEVY